MERLRFARIQPIQSNNDGPLESTSYGVKRLYGVFLSQKMSQSHYGEWKYIEKIKLKKIRRILHLFDIMFF